MSCAVSIVVPVYMDWDRIPSLLQALNEQSLAPSEFELLLVDNGSADVPSVDGLPGYARLLHCPTPGSYAARNVGAREACGEILVFTDADCRPSPEWLEEIVTAFRASARDDLLIAGAVRVRIDGEETAAARYDAIMGLPQAHYVRRGYAVTANLAVRRSLFHALGGFDSRRFSGGDADFCLRARRVGAELLYLPEAWVWHPARTSMASLIRKVRRTKGGQLRHGSWRRRGLYFIRSLFPPVGRLGRLLALPSLSMRERFQLCGIQLRLWWEGLLEVGRLVLGGEAERQ